MRKLLLPLLLLLSACIDVKAPPVPAPLNYAREAPFRFTVSNIAVLEDYRSPGRLPNVEHVMPYSPADAMQLWAKDRLRKTGGAHTLQLIIKDASVVEKQLPTKKGVAGWVTVEQDKQYDATLEVELRIYGTSALSEANTTVRATATMTLSEGASVNTRDVRFRALLDELMKRADTELSQNISLYLRDYIAP